MIAPLPLWAIAGAASAVRQKRCPHIDGIDPVDGRLVSVERSVGRSERVSAIGPTHSSAKPNAHERDESDSDSSQSSRTLLEDEGCMYEGDLRNLVRSDAWL
jgi:hypothetical protein